MDQETELARVQKILNFCESLEDHDPSAEPEIAPWLSDDGSHFSELENPDHWLHTARRMRRDMASNPSMGRAVVNSQLRRLERDADRELTRQIREAHYEDTHPVLQKAPHGEKQDRTNKTFGPQRMKDNRFVRPTDRC
ncbi:MAG: hypothetical protein KGL39_16410 [Patescibacteria group bacterium]|nr:hypothetical protein [Patescibacteria group bacterium]